MRAHIVKLQFSGKWLAWCGYCDEKYRWQTKIAATNWAHLHNSNHHPSEAVPTGAASSIPEGEK